MFTQEQIFQRFILAKGEQALKNMQNATVLQIGVGAVGGFCTEILCRCGLGRIILVDFDTVDVSNINRQIVATTKTVGQPKVEIMKARIADINPECKVETVLEKVDGKRIAELIQQFKPTIVCDCIDLFVQKCEIIQMCINMETPIVSSMGAARKHDPSKINVCPLNEVDTCPLAKRVKKTLNLDHDKPTPLALAVLSKENACKQPVDENGLRTSLPSFSVITTCFGVWVAHAAISYLLYGEFPKGFKRNN